VFGKSLSSIYSRNSSKESIVSYFIGNACTLCVPGWPISPLDEKVQIALFQLC